MANVEVSMRGLIYAAQIAGYPDNMISGNTWQMEIGKMPETPDTAISIIATGGTAPNPKWLIDYPSVQVMVRGSANGYLDARSKAKEIKDLLLGFISDDVDGDRWVACNMISDITKIGNDDANRPLFTLNFGLIIEPASSDLTNRTAL